MASDAIKVLKFDHWKGRHWVSQCYPSMLPERLLAPDLTREQAIEVVQRWYHHGLAEVAQPPNAARELAQQWRDRAFGSQHMTKLKSDTLEECAEELDALAVRQEAEIERLRAEVKHNAEAWDEQRGRAERAEARVMELLKAQKPDAVADIEALYDSAYSPGHDEAVKREG